MDSYKFILAHDTARLRALNAVKEAPTGYQVVIKPPNRNLEQNAKFHAICSEFARDFEWSGKKRTVDEWKTLLVSAHSVHLHQNTEVLRGIEDEIIIMRESTASMSKSRMASLIEYSTAYLDSLRQIQEDVSYEKVSFVP